MPVEDVFSISGRGTVVTGRVERGIVKVGDDIEIVGLTDTVKTTCTGVEMFRKLLDQGQAGDNVGVLLRGTKREEVERGQFWRNQLQLLHIRNLMLRFMFYPKMKEGDTLHFSTDIGHNFILERLMLLDLLSYQGELKW